MSSYTENASIYSFQNQNNYTQDFSVLSMNTNNQSISGRMPNIGRFYDAKMENNCTNSVVSMATNNQSISGRMPNIGKFYPPRIEISSAQSVVSTNNQSCVMSSLGRYYPQTPDECTVNGSLPGKPYNQIQQNQTMDSYGGTSNASDASLGMHGIEDGNTRNGAVLPEMMENAVFQQMEDADRFLLMKFFIEQMLHSPNQAARFADILVKNGVGSLEVLMRRLARNEEFLLDLGFDEEVSDNVYLYFKSQPSFQERKASSFFNNNNNNISNNNNNNAVAPRSPRLARYTTSSTMSLGSSQRKYGNVTAFPRTSPNGSANPDRYSFFSSNASVNSGGSRSYYGSVRSGVGSMSGRNQNMAISEVANAYYQAAYCDKHHALESLQQAANVDLALLMTGMFDRSLMDVNNLTEVIAVGFLMRMFALGQGSVQPNRHVATSLSNVLLPILIEENTVTTQQEYKCYIHYLLGVCYSEGLTVPKNDIQALHWYKASAEQGGYALAQAYLGYYYYTLGMKHLNMSQSAPSSVTEANTPVSPSAQSGRKNSLSSASSVTSPPRRLGVDSNIQQYFEEAVKWYRLSAEQGYSPAECNLGLCYENGHGVTKNIIEALRWYRSSAAQGNAIAQYNVGFIHEQGIPNYLKADYGEALRFYRQAAQSSYLLAEFKLGEYYFTQEQYGEAVQWYLRCAEKGYAQAQCQVGVCYEYGYGVEKNVTEAARYYEMSAAQGHPAALYNLGYCYFMGMIPLPGEVQSPHNSAATDSSSASSDKFRPNIIKAVELYHQAAMKGNVAAQNNLGYCYFHGYGVKQNYFEAVHWYRLSADQGYAPAQYNLGYCYDKGYGVPTKKTNEMLRWYQAAAAQGNERAKKALDRYR